MTTPKRQRAGSASKPFEAVYAPVDSGRTESMSEFHEGRKEISRILAITALLLTLLMSTSLSAVLATLLNSPTEAVGEGGLALIMDTFLLTAPLTIAIAVLVASLIREWFGGWLGQVLVFTLVLTATTFLFQVNGSGTIRDSWSNSQVSGPYGYTITLLLKYAVYYWWKPLLASAILGCSAGYMTHRIITRATGREGMADS